jgi:hypothetical protein
MIKAKRDMRKAIKQHAAAIVGLCDIPDECDGIEHIQAAGTILDVANSLATLALANNQSAAAHGSMIETADDCNIDTVGGGDIVALGGGGR